MTSNWFDNIYIKAKGDSNQVPWANMTASAYLKDWLNHSHLDQNFSGLKALVVGCGLGDDAEALAQKGFNVTAFDISPTAIDWCKQRFPNSSVNYVVADLFNLNPQWLRNFDFVFEARTIQSLPLTVRSQVMETVAQLVASEGTLLVVTVTRDTPEEPDGPPYPLSLEEIDYFQKLGLQEIRRDAFSEKNRFPKRLRIEYLFQQV
ncbi:class I SAM-dependent methyltransferase [Rivularia sp. UHCC 0363]|uniref:class I SAM-dependent methyltransferase n=1 Tax=Rivularia sp. UHCC 0363 TaxID=3110244 RepID=UPI002B1F2497|nr:class I SAM-dependent methyltransferase [Rivularia sp. UHCC 0363]MEA5593550.1 class I SAM-dependent methyltransferase [Rivularia sp. UHCC 0363]